MKSYRGNILTLKIWPLQVQNWWNQKKRSVSVLLKQIRKNSCTIITPELEGFKRPNWAQIKAELCVHDLGGYFLDLTTGWLRNDAVVGYTS